MTQTIKINNQDVSIKECNGQRVITFKDIDRVHKRPEGTARKRFNDNKNHLIEGTDFYKVCSSEIRTSNIMQILSKSHSKITLITESGYLMLVKSFTDDLAWEVQRALVNTYFKAKSEPSNYRPKMTSLGEVASYIKTVSRYMEKQGNTPEQIMQAIDEINIQFGIRLPKLAKVNTWEQMTIICIQ